MVTMKLRDWRKSCNMTLVALSRELGVTTVSLGRYERGARLPEKRVMEKIIEVTQGQVTPNDWFGAELSRPQRAA
jgi:transcriptional regulator with XRE-family HTH domain